MTREMMDLKEKICKKIEEVGKNGVTQGNVEMLNLLIVSAEKLMKMEVLEQELDGGHSERGYSRNDGGGYSRRNSRGEGGNFDGISYNDGGSSYARRRDSMGRYSRDDGKDEFMERLHEMMRETNTPEERDMMKKLIRRFEEAD